ncbi:MAG: alpha/beta fold hydrolase [Actinomycetota bacterium]
MPTLARGATNRTVSVGAQRLRVMVEGEGLGRPLLLINGIGATGELFGPLRRHLGDRETIAFDAPGIGGSSTPSMPQSMRALARTVAAMVDQLGHDTFDVLGLSWGGALAQELTRRHPERVRRLILCATMPGWLSVPGRPLALSILMSPLRYYSPDYLRRVAPVLYGGAIKDNPGLLAEHAALRSTRPPTTLGYTYQLMALQGWTSLPWLHKLHQPTLILAGDDDPIIPVANAKIMAGRIPDADLQVLEGAGHLFAFLKGEEVAGRIGDFLDAPALGNRSGPPM